MSSKISAQIIMRNATLIKTTVVELQKELSTLAIQFNKFREQELKSENQKLATAVEKSKNTLIHLEGKNGVRQVPIPNFLSNIIKVASQSEESTISSSEETVKFGGVDKLKKELKTKGKTKPQTVTEDLPIDIGRLDLRVALIEHIEQHPDADSLYILKVNCGEKTLRTVCSGLVKFVPMADLEKRNVVLLCNLKPVKMRGIVSEAMVMCASTTEVVEVLQPPEDSKPGDIVECEGYIRNADPIMNPKKKIFETVANHLLTNDSLEACYKNKVLCVRGKGIIVSKTLKNCQIK